MCKQKHVLAWLGRKVPALCIQQEDLASFQVAQGFQAAYNHWYCRVSLTCGQVFAQSEGVHLCEFLAHE